MSLSCLIIDDEPIARNILEKYVSRTPHLGLAASLDNGLEAISYLNEHEVDLIFLDINMPEFTGIELLKSMRNPPAVIITTAYSEYGAESYDYEVTDYLLKPIPFERFLKAVQKVTVKTAASTQQAGTQEAGPVFIFLKEEHQTHKVLFSDIRYIQAYGNYLKVFVKDSMLLVRKTITDMEAESAGHLIRIHKSYLISMADIDRMEGNEITMSHGEQLPIGKVYKKAFDEAMSRRQ